MVVQSDIVIETVSLTKTFKDFWRRPRVRAVDNLNLQVRRGEVFGLLGPNGSGKSTTLKLMLGLLFPTRGTVAVLGHHPRNLRMKEHIGFLPEETYLYRYLNAAETLDFYGRLFDLPGSQRRLRSERLLDMVGLTAHRRRPLGEYSKGMARRIGLAQALINDPDLLLLDEPTSGLDPIGTREIKDLVLELKGRGKTIFLCSHLLADVEDICDHVAIMYGGKVRVAGTLDELLEERNVTRIEAEDVPAEEMEAAVATLRQRNPANRIRIEKPMMRLDEYFLTVIEDARKEEPVSSGAAAGKSAAVAAFWEDQPQPQPVDIIDQLVKTETTEEPELAATVVPETPESRQDPVLIESLVGETPAPVDKAEVKAELQSQEKMEAEERRQRTEALLKQFVQPPEAADKPKREGQAP